MTINRYFILSYFASGMSEIPTNHFVLDFSIEIEFKLKIPSIDFKWQDIFIHYF